MSARFRIIQFKLDPFLGGHLPIAAIVESEGRVELALARQDLVPFLPRTSRETVSLVLNALRTDQLSMNRLPMTVGPHALLGEEHAIPSGVVKPLEWVRHAVLRTELVEPADVFAGKPSRRQVVGFKFLAKEGVSKWVKKGYVPAASAAPRRYARVLPAISHYVCGERQLLLMEPVAASMPQFASALQQVGTAFLAWQHSLEKTHRAQVPEFIAYILPDGNGDRVAEAKEALRSSADMIVDVADQRERTRFVRHIESVGRSFSVQ